MTITWQADFKIKQEVHKKHTITQKDLGMSMPTKQQMNAVTCVTRLLIEVSLGLGRRQ